MGQKLPAWRCISGPSLTHTLCPFWIVRMQAVWFLFSLSSYPAGNGCRYVFLDIGANIGVHTRFLFEPTSYPNNKYRSVFDDSFPRKRFNRTDVCAFGFEANPAHKTRLQRLQHHYAAMGWRAIFFHEAVAAEEGMITFWHVRSTA